MLLCTVRSSCQFGLWRGRLDHLLSLQQELRHLHQRRFTSNYDYMPWSRSSSLAKATLCHRTQSSGWLLLHYYAWWHPGTVRRLITCNYVYVVNIIKGAVPSELIIITYRASLESDEWSSYEHIHLMEYRLILNWSVYGGALRSLLFKHTFLWLFYSNLQGFSVVHSHSRCCLHVSVIVWTIMLER